MKNTDTSPDSGQQEERDLSLEDELSSAFDDMESSDEGESDAEVEITAQDDEEVEAEAEGQDPEVEAPEEYDEQEAPVAEAETEYNEAAPERWPDEIKQVYADLTPSGKKAMLDGIYKPMQAAFTQKTQGLADERRALMPMMAVLQKHQASFDAAGVDPMQALNRQMEWSAHFARVGNEQGAVDLAAAYGQTPGQGAADAYLTPVEKRQQQQLDQITQQMQLQQNQNAQNQQNAAQQAENARVNDVRSSIDSFKNETQDGIALHPHIEKVSGHMAGLIRGGLVDKVDVYGQPIPHNQQLGQAYQIACDMDPSIRSARTTRSRKEQVARATSASREVVSKSPAGSVSVPPGSIEDSISDLYDKLDRSVA